MKRLLAALLLSPALALGAANDLFVNQRDANNANTLTRTVTSPSADAILGYAFTPAVPGNRVPVFFALGSGLQLTGNVLSATGGGATAVTWESITGKPLTFTPAAHSHAWASITGTPTTLSGYGITDAATSAQLATGLAGKLSTPTGTQGQYVRGDGSLGSLAPVATAGTYASLTAKPTTLAGYGITDAASTAALAGKFNTPTGTTAQYVRGDGSLATLPVAKRIETYSGTTNTQGQISVTYSTPFATVPVVQPPAPALANQVWTTVSSTVNGFTLQLSQRNAVTLLGLEVLLGATVPVSGTTAGILVVAQ